MRVKNRRKLGRRKWASSKGVIGFSDRSGMPGKYSQMKLEEGTGHWIHKKEDDGRWNLTEAYKEPMVPAEPQKLQHARNIPSSATTEATSLYLEVDDTSTGTKLYIDELEQEALEIQ